MTIFVEKQYISTISYNKTLLLVGDIGGTNSNFGFFDQKDGIPVFLFSMHAKSQTITNFADCVTELLRLVSKKYGVSVTYSCFAAAGIVSAQQNFCKPTNLDITINADEILQKTSLKYATIINNFQIIGYGINLIAPHDLVQINNAVPRSHGNKAIIGAGTGLGKSILIWNENQSDYLPLASEGGHADFASHNDTEFDLIRFIQETEKRPCAISWEDMLSGNGIKRLYSFFKAKNPNIPSHPIIVKNGIAVDKIFDHRTKDEHSMNTFNLYSTFYARCAKNLALDALALGGIYIAGGIAAKNLPLFQQDCFMREFINCGKQEKLLQQIPISIITDYNISLFGAAYYLIQKTSSL